MSIADVLSMMTSGAGAGDPMTSAATPTANPLTTLAGQMAIGGRGLNPRIAAQRARRADPAQQASLLRQRATYQLGAPAAFNRGPAPLTFDQFMSGMTPDQFNSGANAGVDFQSLFGLMQQMGASNDKISGFAPWLASTFGNDPAGQFGKYAQPGTIQANLQRYLQTGDTSSVGYGADAGSGGWLTHNLGDVLHWMNPMDIATGGKWGDWTGQLSNNLYDETFGRLGGWSGSHLFGDSGLLATPTRGALSAAATGGLSDVGLTEYEAARQRGLSAEQAAGEVSQNLATAGAVAGTVLSGGALSPALATLLSAGAGASASAIRGDDLMTALRNTGINAAAGYTGGQLGSLVRSLTGSGLLGGVASGAARGGLSSALHGSNLSDILRSMAMGGATSGVAGGTGSQFAGQLSNYFLRQLFNRPPQRRAPTGTRP